MLKHATQNKKKLAEGTNLLREYEAAYQTQKEATSATNKLKTKVKNFFKEFIAVESIPATSSIEIDGIVYSYKASESDILDPRKWYELWQSGEITEDQYFASVNVVKDEAKLAIGEDQCLSIQVRVTGKTSDVRRDDKEAGHREGVSVLLPEGTKPGIVKRTLPKPVSLQVPAKPARLLAIRKPIRK